jgi:hypothetical protein
MKEIGLPIYEDNTCSCILLVNVITITSVVLTVAIPCCSLLYRFIFKLGN